MNQNLLKSQVINSGMNEADIQRLKKELVSPPEKNTPQDLNSENNSSPELRTLRPRKAHIKGIFIRNNKFSNSTRIISKNERRSK